MVSRGISSLDELESQERLETEAALISQPADVLASLD